MLTLLIDNYDSFTYNLFQLLAEVNGAEPLVVRNDAGSWEELERLGFDNVVLSPGPGRPENGRDFGVCAEAIRRCRAPLLGVCLGHQGIGWLGGGSVVAAPEPMHGRVGDVEHNGGDPLFAGIPRRFAAVRYHSLCLETPLPGALEPIAWSEDGVVMALAHRSRPQWGVQFHPESVATEHGARLLANFRDLTAAAPSGGALYSSTGGKKSTQPGRRAPSTRTALELRTRRLDHAVDPERAFAALYAGSESAFWLDSARPGPRARFSFMGDASGPHGATVLYDLGRGELRVEGGGETEVRSESIFEFLEREPARLPDPPAELPHGFACGLAGYLGYELKAECGGERAHRSPLPDAAFVRAGRMLAFDHELGHTYLLCLREPGEREDADDWLTVTERRLTGLTTAPMGETGEGSAEPSPVSLHLARSRAEYLGQIEECQRLLRAGESYEICLTNRVEGRLDVEPLDLYRRLRRVNPAPFGAYLRFGKRAVLSSSPERFLAVGADGGVEARPIKGTCRRGKTPAEDARLAARLRADPKSRAENLMIADLLRNDLGRVCRVGSVAAPALIEVESYETVHQLVSTVRGRLRPEVSAPACVRACFPPGSMTGAPKLRTMEILDELEGAPRGVYAGAVGWFGAGGACDLSVAIRAVVLDGEAATIGAGGAIVLRSEPTAEFEEMLLKAAAPLAAIDPRGARLSRRSVPGALPLG